MYAPTLWREPLQEEDARGLACERATRENSDPEGSEHSVEPALQLGRHPNPAATVLRFLKEGQSTGPEVLKG